MQFLDWITNETFTTSNGLKYTYRNICLQYNHECFQNKHARLVAEIFYHNHTAYFNVTYPLFKSQLLVEPIDLSQVLGGIQVDSSRRIKKAKAWMILYQLQENTELSRKLSLDFESSLSNRVEEQSVPADLFNLYYFHSDVFEMELSKSSRSIIPKFAYTIFLLIAFSIFCTLSTITDHHLPDNLNSFLLINWLTSKPLMGLIGVISTFFAIISTIGLLQLFHVPFVDIIILMPFLSLSYFLR
ncbi:unnamed protein product [Thelazia callipaeda]|uniref:SSD domain-containing protein n=1 Tax=Thelazia callipaeda TaxID=103827 RepID=A0A0N5CTM3_THECL|nr:unnamed protein product [Thelazia callipaeda]